MADLAAHGTFDEVIYSDDLSPVDFDAHAAPSTTWYSDTQDPIRRSAEDVRGVTPFSSLDAEDLPVVDYKYYRMRAWNGARDRFETWTSGNAPSATPPTGEVVQATTIVGKWEV